MLAKCLAHRLTRGLDIDAPETTSLRRRIIRRKPFLRRIYQEWYQALAAAVPVGPGAVLELGSGPGFLSDSMPDLITSDLLPVPGVDLLSDARASPSPRQPCGPSL